MYWERVYIMVLIEVNLVVFLFGFIGFSLRKLIFMIIFKVFCVKKVFYWSVILLKKNDFLIKFNLFFFGVFLNV